jgi:hypothetical protein
LRHGERRGQCKHARDGGTDKATYSRSHIHFIA